MLRILVQQDLCNHMTSQLWPQRCFSFSLQLLSSESLSLYTSEGWEKRRSSKDVTSYPLSMCLFFLMFSRWFLISFDSVILYLKWWVKPSPVDKWEIFFYFVLNIWLTPFYIQKFLESSSWLHYRTNYAINSWLTLRWSVHTLLNFPMNPVMERLKDEFGKYRNWIIRFC